MADERTNETAVETTDDAGRRGFLLAAVAGVAGVAGVAALAGEAAAAEGGAAPTRKGRVPAAEARPVQNVNIANLTEEEKAKERKRAQAEALLRELGDDVEIQWVKGNVPGARRIIQMKG
jgi:hypothetical protein